MNKKLQIKEHVELLHKNNGTLYVLCILIGILTGITVSIYRYGLSFADHLREKFLSPETLNNPLQMFLIWILFIAIGLFIDFISRKFPVTGGSGIPQVKALILKRLDYVFWVKELGVKFLGGILGIGAGLSLGREGPSVQLGSYIGYGVSKIFKRTYKDGKYLVTSGASAGLAGAFGAPLAGVIFSMEELHRFFSSKLIVCTFLASITANFAARRMFGMAPAFNLLVEYPNDINPYLQFTLFIVFGIIIAFFGKLFTVSLIKSQDYYRNIKVPRCIKVSFVMTLSYVLCFIMSDLTGGGHHLAEHLPSYKQTISFLLIMFFIKLFFTTVSYATGFQGGIFLPMLVLGAILGKIYGLVLIETFGFSSNYITHYMILGMAAFFVAVVKAPVTGAILILEMTGNFDHLLAIATVSIVAYYVTELLGLEPIYEILYDRMPKNVLPDDIHEEKHEHEDKTIISIPITDDSEFADCLIKDISWPKHTLLVSIQRGETEYIPNGESRLYPGDYIVILLPEKKAEAITEDLFKRGTGH